MKLLLTSNGLSNNSIAGALEELVGKKPSDTKVAFIPTAANIDRGDKTWLINDLHRILERGYIVDVIEIAVLSKEEIEEALTNSDVIFVGGGNIFYLSYWMKQKGLFDILPRLLETRVYAGISAGSMVTGQSLTLNKLSDNEFVDEDYGEVGPENQSSRDTLKFVDFIFRPHLNASYFPLVNAENIKQKAGNLGVPIYAIDDNSALKVVDGEISVVTEGDWIFFE